MFLTRKKKIAWKWEWNEKYIYKWALGFPVTIKVSFMPKKSDSLDFKGVLLLYVHFQLCILFWGSTGETFHDSQLKNKCDFHFLLAIYAESQYIFWLKQSQLLSL